MYRRPRSTNPLRRGRAPYKWAARPVVFVDGEGITRVDGRHDYVYVAAVDEHGTLLQELKSNSALDTKDCLDFLLSLPDQVFAFSFKYDLTKMLEDVDDLTLFLLNHTDDRRRERKRGKHVLPEYWEGGYYLNLMQGRFDVEKPANRRHARQRTTVWDVFKYFQSSFVNALEEWNVGTPKERADILDMKNQRGGFAHASRARVQAYCQEECRLGAQLVRALIDSMQACDLRPTKFYSPGSLAKDFLMRWDVLAHRAPPPKKAAEPVSRAYFGGWFELSRIGTVSEPVYAHDVSSAYPYQLFQLPCLACGRWEYTTSARGLERAIAQADLALVRCSTPAKPANPFSAFWGALPFRYQDGTTSHPIHVPKTWVWKQEYLAARDIAGARASAAWLYRTPCDHRPFSPIAEAYRYRCELSKEGKGKVYKLGMNSCYGVTCQYRGQARFQSYVWAGNVTSGTRAQLYRLMATASNPRSVLMTATDGVLSTERLTCPPPLDTGTSDLEKPLGGWEVEVLPRGVHLIRPGIYFPIDPDDKQKKKVRSRGFGRAVLFRNMPTILERWAAQGPSELEFEDNLFFGMKSTIQDLGYELRRSDRYGRWSSSDPDGPFHVTRRCDYSPLPKRAGALPSGELVPWDRPRPMPRPYAHAVPGRSSAPYNPALAARQRDAVELETARERADEQPDAGADVEPDYA